MKRIERFLRAPAALSVLVLLALALGLAGCATGPSAPAAAETPTAEALTPEAPAPEAREPFTLELVETTDVHGAIFPYDFINDRPAPTSLAQLYSYLKARRAESGLEMLLLDDGDILQGQPVVYYSNFEDTADLHIAAQVMNYMGYNAGAIGNHDIEAGHDVYDRLPGQFHFPWLAANAVHSDTGQPYFPAYAVFTKGGARIAVLGLTNPAIPTWLPRDLWEGMRFEDSIESARKWVPLILSREKPDLLVGLFHSGTDFTYGGYTAESADNPNAALLVAQQVPGFDLIFVGHDHAGHNEWVEGPDGKRVLLLGGLNDARTAAVARAGFSWDAESGVWEKSLAGEIVEVADYPPDPEFMASFAGVVQSVKDYVAKPIGTFTQTIATRQSMFGDSPFVDLIHIIQLGLTGADVSFAAPLSADARIDQGEVYVRDMFNLYRYENLLYTMRLTGRQIKDFLEYSYNGWFGTMTGPDDHLINFKRDSAGRMIWNERYKSYDTATRYYNYDSAAGIDYTVDVSRKPGERITIFGFSDGRPFDLNAPYTVAINSYRATGGGGHITRGTGLKPEDLDALTLSSTVKDLRYYLMKWIEGQGTVTPRALGNWKVVPQEWWEKARATDYAILYEGKRVEE